MTKHVYPVLWPSVGQYSAPDKNTKEVVLFCAIDRFKEKVAITNIRYVNPHWGANLARLDGTATINGRTYDCIAVYHIDKAVIQTGHITLYEP